MSPEKQVIAIAEACGETALLENMSKLREIGYPTPTDALPSYLNILDSMRKPESLLNDIRAIREAQSVKCENEKFGDDWFSEYCDALQDICGGVKKSVIATAAQRAEAFLRTIGRWEEEQP